MRFSIVNHNKEKLNSFFSYAIAVIIAVLLAVMVGGVSTSETYFERINAPLWLYVATSVFASCLFIIWLAVTLGPTNPSSFLSFDTEAIHITKGRRVIKKVALGEIEAMELKPDYIHDESLQGKRNYFLHISYASSKEVFNLALDKAERKELEGKINRFISSGSGRNH